jgi:hypothetical protein
MKLKKVGKKHLKKLKKIKPKENKYDNIKDIVDRKQPFRLIYSGVEGKKYFTILYNMGIKNYLMSYHYIREKHIKMSKYIDMGLKFFIDSGAYTYQNDEKYQDYTEEQWEQQIKEYLDWARDNKETIFAIANLDLEYLVGQETVCKWNEEYFEPFMLETGIPVCFIWHDVTGIEEWERYCERYSYVGFPWLLNEGLYGGGYNRCSKLLKIAEKHNTLVHGMGMTRASMLTKLPFYSSDSTTWKMGLEYGNFLVFTGKNIRQIKKDQYDTAVRYMKNYKPSLKIDYKKLYDYDVEQVVQTCAYAFILAEKYIQTRLRARMYWLKPEQIEQSVNDIEFPSPDYLLNELSEDETEYKEWAKKFNINPDNEDVNYVKNSIIDITCLLNWDDEEYEEAIQHFYPSDDTLKEVYDLYINKPCDSKEEMLSDLIGFCTDVIEGRNDKLLVAGTNFDRMAKERDNYITDEEYEYVDVPKEEVQQELHKLLPSPDDTKSIAPEIDNMDDEIFSNLEIVPVRDKKGRFLKGQKKVRKRKNIYSEKYPKLICSTCYAAQTCPEYKDGYVCAYNRMFKRFDCRNPNDIIEAIQGMINLNMERMQRTAIFEMLDGGMPDGNVTNFIDQNVKLLTTLKTMYKNDSELMKHTRTINADGSMQETTSIKQGGGGIIEQMLKSMTMQQNTNNEDENDKEV